MIQVPESPVKVGQYNQLTVVSEVDFGVYLDGKKFGEILMPKRYVPEDCEIGDVLDVMVSLDSEDRLVATTEIPYAFADELAYLEVIASTQVGAFLDWGMPKDLLVPFKEQKRKLYPGQFCIAYIYFDDLSERLVASTKTFKYINPKAINYRMGQEVQLIICNPFDLGFNVIIDRRFQGVIYKSEIFQALEEGQEITGYIKKVREDGKIDCELQKTGEELKRELSREIHQMLKDEGGFLPFTDKSPPEEIYKKFEASKKAYKKAVGHLYKRRMIRIEEDGIHLTEEGS